MLRGLNFQQLAEVFTAWAQPYLGHGDRAGLRDGTALKGSVVNPCDAQQQFASLVSVFSQFQGIAVGVEQYQNHEGSEIQVVEGLIAALNL